MNEFEYLEYEYYDAQAKRPTVSSEDRGVLRDQRVPEEFQLTYEHIRRTWRNRDESARLHMLAQLTEMGQRRDIDRHFLLKLTTLHGTIRAALST